MRTCQRGRKQSQLYATYRYVPVSNRLQLSIDLIHRSANPYKTTVTIPSRWHFPVCDYCVVTIAQWEWLMLKWIESQLLTMKDRFGCWLLLCQFRKRTAYIPIVISVKLELQMLKWLRNSVKPAVSMFNKHPKGGYCNPPPVNFPRQLFWEPKVVKGLYVIYTNPITNLFTKMNRNFGVPYG